MQARAKSLVFAAFLVICGIGVMAGALMSQGAIALVLFVAGLLLLAAGLTVTAPGPKDRQP